MDIQFHGWMTQGNHAATQVVHLPLQQVDNFFFTIYGSNDHLNINCYTANQNLQITLINHPVAFKPFTKQGESIPNFIRA